MKIRTIITQDAEVDDQNSLRHFLLCANEVEIQGIIQTSSKFHWIGVPGAVKPEKTIKDDFEMPTDNGPFDAPYRWPGTDWMFREIDDYEKDYPNLCIHAEGYPAPDYLRSITKIGNIGYEGEMEAPTEGSEWIRMHILDDDPRPLYLQVWGGTNTIARALMDIQKEYEGTPEWPALHAKISSKVIITACGEQDPAYRTYVAEEWPDLMFIKTLQMQSYAYPWFIMPEGESKDTLRAAFMKAEILNGKSALADGYCTWMDGKYYEGEEDRAQFGANPTVADQMAEGFKHWFGEDVKMDKPQPYDFLSEGDSPTFFILFDRGFRTLENPAWGGLSGRYCKQTDQFNSKGQPLNIWDVCKDTYIDRDGVPHEVESMWPYVADIQRDFAARVTWAGTDKYEDADHAPSLTVEEGLDLSVPAGGSASLHAQAASPDGDAVTVTWKIYQEASAAWAGEAGVGAAGQGGAPVGQASGPAAQVTIPAAAVSGDQLHIIVKAEAAGAHRLTRYQQVVITVK